MFHLIFYSSATEGARFGIKYYCNQLKKNDGDISLSENERFRGFYRCINCSHLERCSIALQVRCGINT